MANYLVRETIRGVTDAEYYASKAKTEYINLDSRAQRRFVLVRAWKEALEVLGRDSNGLKAANQKVEEAETKVGPAKEKVIDTILTTNGLYTSSKHTEFPIVSHYLNERSGKPGALNLQMRIAISGRYWFVNRRFPELKFVWEDLSTSPGLRTYEDGIPEVLVPENRAVLIPSYTATGELFGVFPLAPIKTGSNRVTGADIDAGLRSLISVGQFAKLP